MSNAANISTSIPSASRPHVEPAIPASPPSSFGLLAENNILRDSSFLAAPPVGRSVSPGAVSLQAARSPGQSLISSPNPPALPSLPKYRGGWDSLSSSPEHRRTDSSAYYTTAWGSPYATPSPPRPSRSIGRLGGINIESRDSSPFPIRDPVSSAKIADSGRHTSGATGLFSKKLYGSLGRSAGKDLLGKQGGKSIKDFTQDWINQHLSGERRSERTNWLSDDSGSEAGSYLTAYNHLGDDQSEGWLGLEEDSRDEELLKTPTTLANFVKRKANARGTRIEKPTLRTKHLPAKSTDTLKQADFWDFAYDRDASSPNMSETGSPAPVEQQRVLTPVSGADKPISPVDKPLPPPPVSDQPEADQSASTSVTASTPVLTQKPPLSQSQSFQRPKKKIVWRGRACVIALPLEDHRGSLESGIPLLTSEDVEARLQKFESEGYDTRGFGQNTEDSLEGQSRPSYPDQAETEEERKEQKCVVSFPDQSEWEDYVEYLKEEKLRALGVSLGEIDAQNNASPASVSMSHASSLPVLPLSPPVPTSSVAANHLHMGNNPFSPHFNQSANGSNLVSLASPSPHIGGTPQPSSHTPFYGADQAPGSAYPFPQFQPTPPAQGNFPSQNFFNLRQGEFSQVGTSGLSNLNNVISPISPPNFESGDQFPSNTGDLMELVQPTRAQTPPNRQEQPAQDNAWNDESEPLQSSSNLEIAHPTPRGHRHNVSETLQKGVEQAESRLEDTIHQQLEDDKQRSQGNFAKGDLMKSRWAIPEEDAAPEKQNQEPSNSLSQVPTFGDNQDSNDVKEDKSEIDTNPSLSGTPALDNDHARDSSHVSWQRSRGNTSSFTPGHQGKASESALNVEAKAFDPTGSFASNNFSFGGNSFQPSSGFQDSTSIFNPGSTASKPLNAAAGSFNVAAPAFTPGNFRDSASSNSAFKFSSASFNVEAPVFNPGRSLNGNSGTSSLTGSVDHSNAGNKIFGDINISQISKPARRSKAIPIVRPDDVNKDDSNPDGPEHVEDEHGRVGLAQNRQKRARRGASDGDKEPEFAIPSHPLTETGQSQSPSISIVTAEGKENATPEGTKDDVHGASDAQPPSPVLKEDVSHDVSQDEISELVVSDLERNLEVSELETSQVENQEKDIASKDVEENRATPEAEKVASEETQKPRTSLSAFAKPFEFKPSVPTLLKPSATSFPKKPVGLEGSRYAVISPPSSPKDDSPTLPLPAETEESEVSSPHEVETPQDKAANFRDTEDTTTRDSPDEPSFQEIDAVMQQLNEDNSDIGIERITTPANRPIPPEPEPESDDLPTDRLDTVTRVRSHAPSPSPRRIQVPAGNLPKLNSNLNLRSPAVLSPNPSLGLDVQSPVHHLHSTNEHLSDWDDAISSGEDEKLQNRSGFFDTHVNELVGGILEDRLNPLERTLSVIQHSVALLSSRSQSRRHGRSVSADIEHSDADDEDEEDSTHNRSRSPMNKMDRRADRIKNAVVEALASHKPTPPEPAPTVDLSQIHNSLAELKLLSAERPQHEQPVNVKNVIEEAILNHPRLNDLQAKIDQDMGAENMQLQVDGLKSMLRLADERAEQEYNSRREAQDALAESRRLQKIAEDDAARYRESAEEAERKFRELTEQKLPDMEKTERRSEALQEQQENLQMTLSELSDKNIALEGTLDEYRLSSDQWRSEIEEAKNENKGLRQTISNLKVLVSETTHARQSLREKFNTVQEDMVAATQNIARDQAAWRTKEQELNSNYAALRAAYDREVKLRERLEFDIHDLEQQEKEATKLKVFFGQSEREKTRLEELVATLREESQEYQNKAVRFEREFNDARESSHMEIQRAKTAMEADVDAANNQVNHIRAEYETQISRLQNQLETVQMDADTAKERHELQLEEASDAKATALQDAIDAKDNALQEQRQSHERSLNDLRERHARVLHNASEDKQRSEAHLAERLSLKDDQIEHLKDKVTHLEEKVEIAKSAARAAAEAAQTQAGKGGSENRSSHSASPSMSFAKGSTVPDKISPQALRESIVVLQDQLQQREGRIEELEGEMSNVDLDAPVKIKEKDTEINWLRELLGVRVDDLQDIIDRLSQPSFNQYAVRDAAIRLKANLQMEQQEKERAMSGGQSFPSISSISNFASSPRSLPLAAAAAWGNWRKGRENSVTSNVSDSTVGSSNHQTPSKSTVNPQGGFLSGLLTPPSSHVRQTPTNASAPPAMRPMGGRDSYPESRPLRRPSNSAVSQRGLSARQMEKRPQFQEPPRTPPLLRNSSYDQDAEANNYGDSAYGVDDGEGSMIGGYVTEESAETITGPFGPQIPS